MVLSKKEASEWRSLQTKSRRYGILIKRVGPANVQFGRGGVYVQLGGGQATAIIDAKIKVKNIHRKRYVIVGSGALATKVQMHRSPKGRWYVGKATFVNTELAMARAGHLKSKGVTAWVEGRTVYSK